MANEVKATEAKSAVIKFDALAAVARTPNMFREKKADRERRAKVILSTPLQFLAQLGKDYAALVASGKELEIAGTVVSTAKPEGLRCAICSGIHGMPNKKSQAAGDTDWNPKNLAKTALFVQAGKLVAFSDSCMDAYVLPNVTPTNVANVVDLRRAYGLPENPKPKKQ